MTERQQESWEGHEQEELLSFAFCTHPVGCSVGKELEEGKKGEEELGGGGHGGEWL